MKLLSHNVFRSLGSVFNPVKTHLKSFTFTMISTIVGVKALWTSNGAKITFSPKILTTLILLSITNKVLI